MKQKRRLRVALLIVFAAACMPQSARSDVLPAPTSEEWVTVALSLEAVGAVERPLTGQASLSFWGGVGTVWNSSDAERSWGAEVAVELRAYGRDKDFSGANGGAYLGIGLLDSGDQGSSVTITPGVKLTLSSPTPIAGILLEPYLGISYPLMRELDGDEWRFPDAPFVTLGFRLVFRSLGLVSSDRGQPGA